MAWVVDTCVLLDIALNDARHGRSSAECLAKYAKDGLTISPVTMVELSPSFQGDTRLVIKFCEGCGVDAHSSWLETDTENAAAGWAEYIRQKRAKTSGKRPIADFFIGGFAIRQQGLITRNSSDFKSYFPKLRIVEP